MTLLTMFMCITVCLMVNADKTPQKHATMWKEIICQIQKKDNRISPRRAPAQQSHLFLSESHIYIISENCDFSDAYLVITDGYGIDIISEIIQIYAEQENSYYIGDLEKGTYHIQIVTEGITFDGNFDI